MRRDGQGGATVERRFDPQSACLCDYFHLATWKCFDQRKSLLHCWIEERCLLKSFRSRMVEIMGSVAFLFGPKESIIVMSEQEWWYLFISYTSQTQCSFRSVSLWSVFGFNVVRRRSHLCNSQAFLMPKTLCRGESEIQAFGSTFILGNFRTVHRLKCLLRIVYIFWDNSQWIAMKRTAIRGFSTMMRTWTLLPKVTEWRFLRDYILMIVHTCILRRGYDNSALELADLREQHSIIWSSTNEAYSTPLPFSLFQSSARLYLISE